MSFIKFLNESVKPEVGMEVAVSFKTLNGDKKDRGSHKITKVTDKFFEIDKVDPDTQKPMKFNLLGYGFDYSKSASKRVKGMSKTFGHVISIFDA